MGEVRASQPHFPSEPPLPAAYANLPSVNTARYVEWLLAQGISPSTVVIYVRRLVRAWQLCDGWGWNLLSLTAAQLAMLADQFPNTYSSRNLLRSALIHYWAMHGVSNPAKAIRPPKPPPYKYRGLEPGEAAHLAETSRGWWPHGGVVLLGLYLALRREEMATLRWENFDPDFEWVSIMGKGSRTRHLPVHDELKSAFTPHVGEGYVFPARRTSGLPHVHTATVRTWIGTVGEKAGVGFINPHALRHTALAEMNDQTGDLRVTQYFAGHADPATTALYTRATEKRLVAAVGSLSYGGR